MVAKVVKFWCINCKGYKVSSLENMQIQTFMNSRRGARAKCPDCGGKMFKILSIADLKLVK